LLANKLTAEVVAEGFRNVVRLTGLRGRWEKLRDKPYVIADTGHNPGAWECLAPAIEDERKRRSNLFMVIGFSGDKDVDAILRIMPPDALYLLTQADCKRAMPVGLLAEKASAAKLNCLPFAAVRDAVACAMEKANDNDMIFIGGSTFVVAEALPLF
jgi:dihydrofolate synthase/folylpolyglutamate synthase